MLFAQQNLARHAQAVLRIGMIRADTDIRQILDLHLLGGIAEEDDGEIIFGIFGENQFSKGHRDLLGRSNAVFPIEYHRV